MTKSQLNSTWVEDVYQPKDFQLTIFMGYDLSILNQMTIIIDNFVDNLNLSYFEQYNHSNKKIGGRPPYCQKNC